MFNVKGHAPDIYNENKGPNLQVNVLNHVQMLLLVLL